MPFPTPGQTIYGGWTQAGEAAADLETRFIARNSKVEGVTGDSVTDDRARLNTLANVTMQPNGGEIDVIGIVRLASDITLPTNVKLNFRNGAWLAPDINVTVTLKSAFSDDCAKIFGTAGRFVFTGNYHVKYARPEWWGAINDATDYLTGTDSTIPIQCGSDAVNYGGLNGALRFLGGGYRITDLLHNGYGVNAGFTSGKWKGEGIRYRGSANYSGTVIFAAQTDRPALNIQGARMADIWGITFVGRLAAYVDANNLAVAAGANAGFDDTLAATWNDGANGIADTQYNGMFAITQDLYSGPQPVIHAPAVNYPWWLGAQTQYNKTFSSGVNLSRLFISGFSAAVVSQPCDADGNGDYLKLYDVWVEKGKYGISIGNSQNRSVAIKDCEMSRMFCMLTSNTHGRQIGKFGGAISNLSTNDCIQIFQFGQTAFLGPTTLINFYGEGLYRAGTIATAGATTELSVHFYNPQFKWGGQNDVRGVPPDVFNTSAVAGVVGGYVDVQIIGGHSSGYPSVVPWIGPGVRVKGHYFQAGARANENEWYAHNALGGGFVTLNLTTPEGIHVKVRYYNVNTGVLTAIPDGTDLVRFGTRPNCIPWWSTAVANTNERDRDPFPVPDFGGSVALAACANVSLVNKTLTFDFTGRAAWQFLQRGPNPGDVIRHDSTGSVFFVRSVVGITVIADLQNNYKSNGAGGYNQIVPFVANAGTFWFRNARVFTTSRFLKAEITAANNAFTGVGTSAGVNASLDADVLVVAAPNADAIAVMDTIDKFIDPAFADIIARSQAAQTMSVNAGGAASVRAKTHYPLRYFTRAGAANR